MLYIGLVWEVQHTPEFEEWFLLQDEDARTHILRDVDILADIGPALGRPLVDTLKDADISNLKELRVQSNGRPFRIFFVFDKNRKGILLIGGNKALYKNFYKKFIPLAEKIYHRYIEGIL